MQGAMSYTDTGRIVSDEALSAANNGNIFARKATKDGAILTAEKQMVV